MPDSTLEEIAEALYSGPPADFVSGRNARAKAVDEAELAAEIRALRKPSVAAWVVNVFAHERAGQLGEALQLAQELREAQEDLDAAALAKLGRERRTLTRRLAQTAAELAGSRGERITTATLAAVEQSISAAFFDPTAAAAVASGRLIRALEPSEDSADIREAVAGEFRVSESAPVRPRDDLQERRARRDAERHLATVEKDLAAAERQRAKSDARLRTLEATATELAEKQAALEAQLAQVREEAKRVARDIPSAKKERADAAAQARAAGTTVEEARRALERG